MRKVVVFFVALSLVLPALAFGASNKEWSVGGVVDRTKTYDTNEAHGYIMRIDVKRPNDKIKKVYVKKSTVIVDGSGKESSLGKVKVGKPIQIDYKKSGDDFVATKVIIL